LKHITGAAVLTVNVERVKGLLAEAMGDLDAAIMHLQSASEFCRGTGHRPELAWSTRDYAKALMQRRGPDDQRNAVPVLEDCLAIATELEMAPLAASASAHQAELVSILEAGKTYPGGLTQRETEVLVHLAQGMTNREIAKELVLSHRTVARHVSNIYTKINARNRAEATTFALSHLAS
jgi:DNA-binding CsgD family transcriptional regulator